MSFPHAIVWIDHDEARVIHFDRENSESLILHSKHRRGNLHHKRGQTGSGHAPEDHEFHELVEKSLTDTHEILIVGPANERIELEKHMQKHAKELAGHVIGVFAVDHPTDGELLKLAKKYFRAADRLGTIA